MIQLYEFGTVVLDANGVGRVLVAPTIVRERWKPSQATVSVSSQALESRCAVYLGVGPTPVRLLGETRTGSSGDTYGFGTLELQPGQGLLAVWVDGDPGATATMVVFGEKERPE